MFTNNIGEWAALSCAFFWTISALAFEDASRKQGTMNVNLLRLIIGFVLLLFVAWFYRGNPLPTDAGAHQWIWLSVSGLVGFVLGDLFLFKAFTMIGSRISMLVMSSTPLFSAAIGFLLLNETLTLSEALAMLLTLVGIAVVILFRKKGGAATGTANISTKGVLFAAIGAAGQAGGLVLSKFGMGTYDPLASTQIRLIAGFSGFLALFIIMNRWKSLIAAFKLKKGFGSLFTGAFFGPFLGVTFSLISVKYTETGISSAIMGIVPVLIIVPSVLYFKEKIGRYEILGALISVVGVVLFFVW